VHVPLRVHLPIGRGSFKVGNWRKKYVYILFVSHYLCIYQWTQRASKYFFPGETTSAFTLPFLGCYRCNANGCSQNTLPFLHHKENAPCYGNSRKKCASLAAIARYIMIIFTIGHLQIFKTWYFFTEVLPLRLTKLQMGRVGYSRTRGTVVSFDLFKKLKTLNFKVFMVIWSHNRRSTKVNFSVIGSRCYELQRKLCFCYPKVIYKITFRFGFLPTLINIFYSEFLWRCSQGSATLFDYGKF